jgi:Fe-S cluster assembly protein SufB
MDAIVDSVSIAATFQKSLANQGIIFCSFSEAVKNHPDLVQKYLGSVVPYSDNFFAALNAAVFSDGSFCYILKGVRCPMELTTYFRINAANTGQFERTLIIAEAGAHVSYLEDCSAPMRDENQLHAAVVELIALDNAEIKYSTIQNWYPGDKEGKGGIYNFVTKMIHIGENTRSTIISKGISAGHGCNSYRGLVKMLPNAGNARNVSQCDSMLVGDQCSANTFPYLEIANSTALVAHEATTSKVEEEQIFYFNSRGISTQDAVSMIVNAFCREGFKKLPMEFAVEAEKLLGISLEGIVG